MSSLEDQHNQTKNNCIISSSHMSTSSSTLTVHPHHHHFYGHETGHHYHHQHQHHPQIQQHHYHHVQPPPSMTNSANTRISSEYPTRAGSNKRCCQSCRCSNRLVTGIVITILPIAITSTLICVFMMQKTNLHQYAIYSFVIFCVAFVFPFALFFFTVVLNKLYKFYKREILSNSPTNVNSLMTQTCDSESTAGATSSGFNISSGGNPLPPNNNGAVLSRAIMTNTHHLEYHQSPNDHHSPGGLICYNTRAYHHPYYYQIQDGTVVALAPDNALIIEDSPPSYEMALLCPSVTHNPQCPNSLVDSSQMQVILPKEQNKEKQTSQHSQERCSHDFNYHSNDNESGGGDLTQETVVHQNHENNEPKVEAEETSDESFESSERSNQEETSHQTSQEEF